MGIANTLSLSIHERTRELGLLRAVGQRRRQLRSSVRWESVIVAVFGTLGGIGLGTFLGWGLVRALAAQEGFGRFDAPSARSRSSWDWQLQQAWWRPCDPPVEPPARDILDAIATA